MLKNFSRFILESHSRDWTAELDLHKLGLINTGFMVLKVQVDWENLGQKKFDGTAMPYMKCWFFENWPNTTEDDDSWVEYPDRRLVDMYLNGDPGDVEYVDYQIMKIARDHDADLIWETIDGTWRDAKTGEQVESLHRLI
jgi:hypothetical protein